ncbi:hypothetical protein PoB_003615700 [Plakobranchus ocellatus]|uniref:Uncharacterized protein n=1 Tax=Plakobranchus ocellatus TaxID=259542 RepID=A0AAV4AQQ7_9GAST|nr:hypothetical protein PoB_003615700 [Plakobranchus ocellatus]
MAVFFVSVAMPMMIMFVNVAMPMIVAMSMRMPMAMFSVSMAMSMVLQMFMRMAMFASCLYISLSTVFIGRFFLTTMPMTMRMAVLVTMRMRMCFLGMKKCQRPKDNNEQNPTPAEKSLLEHAGRHLSYCVDCGVANPKPNVYVSAQQSRINQESLLPWLTSSNSSSLITTGHNMAECFLCRKPPSHLVGERRATQWARGH